MEGIKREVVEAMKRLLPLHEKASNAISLRMEDVASFNEALFCLTRALEEIERLKKQCQTPGVSEL